MSDRFEDARLDYSGTMTYGDYLQLDRLLDAQTLRSGDANEMLFIIQHQTSELWMKLAIHELRRALADVRESRMASAFKTLARVSRIMEQLVQAWNVLSTLTPSEYSRLRSALGESSGFQSYQYRIIEFLLGNKNAVMLKPHAHRPDLLAQVEQALAEPSIYDEAIRLLAREGFAIDADQLNRDFSRPRQINESVAAAWLAVYRDPEAHWALYELAEELIDLEDAFRQWRFRYATTVERVIGFKRGTGGTNGVSYLRKMLDVVLFPELWRIRTDL
ncbi:MAG: tryptophan 2,3-dioxygenase [Burkholderiaceae bacterium]